VLYKDEFGALRLLWSACKRDSVQRPDREVSTSFQSHPSQSSARYPSPLNSPASLVVPILFSPCCMNMVYIGQSACSRLGRQASVCAPAKKPNTPATVEDGQYDHGSTHTAACSTRVAPASKKYVGAPLVQDGALAFSRPHNSSESAIESEFGFGMSCSLSAALFGAADSAKQRTTRPKRRSKPAQQQETMSMPQRHRKFRNSPVTSWDRPMPANARIPMMVGVRSSRIGLLQGFLALP